MLAGALVESPFLQSVVCINSKIGQRLLTLREFVFVIHVWSASTVEMDKLWTSFSVVTCIATITITVIR